MPVQEACDMGQATPQDLDDEAGANVASSDASPGSTDRTPDSFPLIDSYLSSKITDTDGIFASIISYCDSTTLLRLCTNTYKANVDKWCKLVIEAVLPTDSRRTEPVQDEGWSTVLRERFALDMELVFTTSNPSPVIGQGGTIHSTSNGVGTEVVNRDASCSFGICGGGFRMRQGIHRSIFTYQPPMLGSHMFDGMEVHVGVVPGGDESSATTATTGSTCLEYAASIQLRPDLPRRKVDIGLEYNCDTGLLSIYKRNDDRWKYIGEVLNHYPLRGVSGAAYCWAAEVKTGINAGSDIGPRKRTFSIRRPGRHAADDFSFETALRSHGILNGLALYEACSRRSIHAHPHGRSLEMEESRWLDLVERQYLTLTDAERSMYEQGRYYVGYTDHV